MRVGTVVSSGHPPGKLRQESATAGSRWYGCTVRDAKDARRETKAERVGALGGVKDPESLEMLELAGCRIGVSRPPVTGCQVQDCYDVALGVGLSLIGMCRQESELCSYPPCSCGLGLTRWLSAYGYVCSLLPSDMVQLSLTTVSVLWRLSWYRRSGWVCVGNHWAGEGGRTRSGETGKLLRRWKRQCCLLGLHSAWPLEGGYLSSVLVFL